MQSYDEKCSRLLADVERYTDNDIVIAFSGGVDSSLLLKLACQSAKKKNKKVYAVTVHTRLHPAGDIAIAKKVAEEAGAVHYVIQIDELQSAGIMNNPPDRCYLCKKYLFSRLIEYAGELKITAVIEGTNEDDLHVYRPGIKALRELNVISPLADAGMIKDDVRKMAGEYGISVADRPSAPCLATRFPYGTTLSYETMEAVEKGEEHIRALGFYNVRLRVHGDIVRIEVDEKDIEKFVQCKNEIISKLKNLKFIYITIDLEGFRSGSMDYRVINNK